MIHKKLSEYFDYKSIQKELIYSNSKFETLIVSIEKGLDTPIQPAPANACLYLIEGKIKFTIENATIIVEKDDLLHFEKGKMHALNAIENSKFIISRTI